MLLEATDVGTVTIDTPLIKSQCKISEIGINDTIFENNGVLPRLVKVFRMPNKNEHKTLNFTRKISLKDKEDNPIYIRVFQEDGTYCWSSPIYIYR